MERPAVVKDAHLDYLDKLRDSGETNMFGAVPYLKARFWVETHEAREILSYWMSTFGDESR